MKKVVLEITSWDYNNDTESENFGQVEFGQPSREIITLEQFIINLLTREEDVQENWKVINIYEDNKEDELQEEIDELHTKLDNIYSYISDIQSYASDIEDECDY